jgi:hypothetical protein
MYQLLQRNLGEKSQHRQREERTKRKKRKGQQAFFILPEDGMKSFSFPS